MEEKTATTTNHQPAVNMKEEPVGTDQHQLLPQEATTVGGNIEPNHVTTEGGSGSGSVDMIVKRKRGRPSKYDVSAPNTISLVSPPPGFLSSHSGSSFEKRGRGRPRGSGKLQLLASLGGFAAETAGGSFIPHVVTVHTGEDIVRKILSFSQRGPRAVCILSATGIVSNVILRQSNSSGGILRYEGRFEILSLSGSFTFGEMAGTRKKFGMLSVSLAKPDGRVFGGGVVGSLIAAGPIQLIVASFKQSIGKELRMRQPAESSADASALRNSDVARVPIQANEISNDEENCTTPTSALSEPTNGEAGNTVTANQNGSPASQNAVGQNTRTILGETISPNVKVTTPQM